MPMIEESAATRCWCIESARAVDGQKCASSRSSAQTSGGWRHLPELHRHKGGEHLVFLEYDVVVGDEGVVLVMVGGAFRKAGPDFAGEFGPLHGLGQHEFPPVVLVPYVL
jgi:hypothetical protein